MRNHDQKARDMARSVLPSTRRRFARVDRRWVHKRERNAIRVALRRVRLADHPDDVQADLTWVDRQGLTEMVGWRRSGDKVAPLLRWVEATIGRDPRLAADTPSGRRAHFRRLLGHGLMADHALFHCELVFDPEAYGWGPRRTRSASERPIEEVVDELLRAGFHAEVNRMIKAMIASGESDETEWAVSGGRYVIRRPDPRPLRGIHDVEKFCTTLGPACRAALRGLHREAIHLCRARGA